jgi:glutamine synthetase
MLAPPSLNPFLLRAAVAAAGNHNLRAQEVEAPMQKQQQQQQPPEWAMLSITGKRLKNAVAWQRCATALEQEERFGRH